MSCKFYDFIFSRAVNHAGYTQMECAEFTFTVHSKTESKGWFIWPTGEEKYSISDKIQEVYH